MFSLVYLLPDFASEISIVKAKIQAYNDDSVHATVLCVSLLARTRCRKVHIVIESKSHKRQQAEILPFVCDTSDTSLS